MSWSYFRSKLGCAIWKVRNLGFEPNAVVVIAAAVVTLLSLEWRLVTWEMKDRD